MKARYVVLGASFAVALITALATRNAPTRDWPETGDEKTLKFSHTFHVKDAGIACADCHPEATKSTLAANNLRAGHDQCKACHEEQLTDKCGYCHLNPDDIQPAVAAQRPFHFSHAQHLPMKGVECVTCHAGIDETVIATAKNMPSMELCVTCHNDVKAPATCEACHMSLAGFMPEDHLAADFKKDHKRRTRLGSLETGCATCHTQDFCADCHEARGLVQFGTADLMTDPAPRGSASDGPKQMALQMVHNLNYRYTHGMEAKSRESDCYSCHSAREFCAECHTAGGVLSPNGVRPAWHLGAGFATVGVGSGGGGHADFARRDIETCVSCHDVQGADPTCIRCHVDGDGFTGTDPRTHEVDYMRSEHGSWHTDVGSPCFNCHTDYNAHPGGSKGRGFCGYCHK